MTEIKPQTQIPPETPKEATKNKPTIMFVDDDKFLLDMYALKFTNNGYDVTVAQGPDEALRILRGGKIPEILLLDVVMPGMDGLQLLQILRNEKIAQDSLVVMLTNQGLADDIARAKKLDVNGYIIKAMTIPSEVLGEVNKIYAASKRK